jgi:hypothetical protein
MSRRVCAEAQACRGGCGVDAKMEPMALAWWRPGGGSVVAGGGVGRLAPGRRPRGRLWHGGAMRGDAAKAGLERKRAALWRSGLHGRGCQPDQDLAVAGLLARAWLRDGSGVCFGISMALLWLLAVSGVCSQFVGGAGSAGMPGQRSRAVHWCGMELLGVKCGVDVWQRSSQREVLLCSRALRLGGQRRRSAARALSRRGVFLGESFAPTL